MKKQLLAIAGMAAITFTAWSAENLITNSSFEDGTADWNFLSMKGKVKNLERSTQVNSGDQAITMSFEAPARDNLIDNKYGAWGRIHKVLALTPGKTYQVKAFAYTDKNYDGIITILVKAGEGTGTKQFFGDGQAYGKWQEIAGEFTATVPDAMIFLNAMGNRGEASFDDVELIEVEPDTAIVKNGSFEKRLTPWIFDNTIGKVEGKVVSTQAHEGKNALQMEVKAAPPKEAGKETYAWGRLYQEIASLAVGKKYKLSVWVMTEEAFAGSIAIWVRCGEGTGTKNIYGGNTHGKWVEVTGEFIPTQANGIIYLNIMADKGIAYFDQVAISPIE
ncbi:MAG: carbohydrate binding domain-containing protein [Victivallaceae bacterium]